MELLKRLHHLTEESAEFVNCYARVDGMEHLLDKDDVMEEIIDIMQLLEFKYKNEQTGTKTAPSAPDTSKFTSVISGKIEHVENQTTFGHYGGSTVWSQFLKIGGGVDFNVRRKIIAEFNAKLSEILDRPAGTTSTIIYCDDGKIVIGQTYGTSWGGIGAYASGFESSWRPEPAK
jgi:hypothetical protein